jgi:hypothetical protein
VLAVWLTQRDDGSWLDVILWQSREGAEHAARHVTEVPEAADWFTQMTILKSQQRFLSGRRPEN